MRYIKQLAITLGVSALLLTPSTAFADPIREKILINNDWTFAYGDASSRIKDYGHGTEYFSYLTKVGSNHGNRGPASPRFNDSDWQKITLPHDWVVDLPFDGRASSSHGYKTVGFRYPETSVGWYRKRIHIPESDKGKRISIEFEGIFRDAEVFCNGFYMGREHSGYATNTYDITEYLDYGADNIITVRADATMEEGWFYEGAGIYRNVYLHKTSSTAIKPYGVRVKEYNIADDYSRCELVSEIDIDELSQEKDLTVCQILIDAQGHEVATAVSAQGDATHSIELTSPVLWSLEHPYLYTLRTNLYKGGYSIGNLIDSYDVKVGIRKAEFDPQNGFFINGKRVQLKGCDLHLDHAGVGTAIPDELWRYKLLQLKKYGFNAIRSSHNPASPAMLDLCDEMGMVVIDENRLMGINEEHFELVKKMIYRDINHPSVILWSVGNEEWVIEGNAKGIAMAKRMTDYMHTLDPQRLTTYGCSGGKVLNQGVDVFGYNYIVQNTVDVYHRDFPQHSAVGTEETSGCGTRGKYETVKEKGWFLSYNRTGVAHDELHDSDATMDQTADGKTLNVIERGWKFYAQRPWLGGIFYWTGFDYRGEPTPMGYPATGSQFGILDYCGFPKEEAFYLKSVWTEEPMVYIAPSWDLPGHEGETVDVWVYSNCDEVQLTLDGRNLGKKVMPENGHLCYKVTYKPGVLEAKAFKNGKKAASCVSSTPGAAYSLRLEPSKTTLRPDGQDIVVLDMTVLDAKGREVPSADLPLSVRASSNISILGWGNGDPGFGYKERPLPGENGPLAVRTFSGKVQVIFRSVEGADGTATISIDGLQSTSLKITY